MAKNKGKNHESRSQSNGLADLGNLMAASDNPEFAAIGQSLQAKQVAAVEQQKEEEARRKQAEEAVAPYIDALLYHNDGKYKNDETGLPTVMPKGRFINPYTFFPLKEEDPERVNRPAAPDYEHGYTGYFECSLSVNAHSGLFIPNTTGSFVTDVSDHRAFEFFSYDDLSGKTREKLPAQPPAHPVIPGSELRGMVRNVYEQLTNSCMLEIDELNYPSARTSEPKKPYLLKKGQDGSWKLYKDFTLFKVDEETPLGGAYKRFTCTLSKPINGIRYASGLRPAQSTGERLLLHVTGPMSNGREDKHDILFDDHSGSPAGMVSSDAIIRFERVIKDYSEPRDAWGETHSSALAGYQAYKAAYESLKNGTGDIEGILVYADPTYEYLSPACITREHFRNTIDTLVAKQHAHNCCPDEEGKFCPACMLFGAIGDETAVGSRIRFTDAVLHGNFKSEICTLAELSGPKISSSEFYLMKPDFSACRTWNYDYWVSGISSGKSEKHRHDYEPKIQGRKVYWHFPFNNGGLTGVIEKTKRNITARILRSGEFQFKVYFEDVTAQELADLAFAIGGFEGRLQKLGHGKPLGLGSVRVKIDRAVRRSSALVSDSEGATAQQVSVVEREITPVELPNSSHKAEKQLITFLAKPLWDVSVPGFIAEKWGLQNWQSTNRLGDLVSYPKPKNQPIQEKNETFVWFANNRGNINKEIFAQRLIPRHLG